MKVTIIKQHKRFEVKCCYKQKVHHIIKKFKNRYFNTSNKIWTIPIIDFTSFINDLKNEENTLKFDITIIDSPTIVYIETKDDKIYVNFSTFINDFAKFMEFPRRVYNSSERLIKMDKEHLDDVVNMSNKIGYKVEIKD